MFSVVSLEGHQVLLGSVSPALGAAQSKTPKAGLIIAYLKWNVAVSGMHRYLKQRFVAWKR